MLNPDQFLESSLGLDEFGIGQLRSVEWSRKYLWSFNFINIDTVGTGAFDSGSQIKGDIAPSKPFHIRGNGSSFFPCVDVDETDAILETFNADAYGTNFRVPLKGAASTIRITFIDDQNNTLYNFFRKWNKQDILNNGAYITPLEEAVKAVELRKVKLASLADYGAQAASLVGLGSQKDNSIADSSKYWVFPEGDITFNGGSTSDVNTYSITLVVAGLVDDQSADGGQGNALQNIVKSLGATAILGGIGGLLG